MELVHLAPVYADQLLQSDLLATQGPRFSNNDFPLPVLDLKPQNAAARSWHKGLKSHREIVPLVLFCAFLFFLVNELNALKID